MQPLEHRNILSTLIYSNLIDFHDKQFVSNLQNESLSLNPNAETIDPLLSELGFKSVMVVRTSCRLAAQALKHEETIASQQDSFQK